VGKYAEQYDAAVSFMKSREADRTDHSGGDLLSHLQATADLLHSWGNTDDVCLAGLCHAVYGTEGFQRSMLDVSQRNALKEVIEPEAEALVYFYASAERNTFCPSITLGPVSFRDRFTNSVFEPDETMLRNCLELMLANDVEISRREENFLRYTQPYNSELFTRCQALVSAAGFTSLCDVYGISQEATG
jgi:hypothetical protein